MTVVPPQHIWLIDWIYSFIIYLVLVAQKEQEQHKKKNESGSLISLSDMSYLRSVGVVVSFLHKNKRPSPSLTDPRLHRASEEKSRREMFSVLWFKHRFLSPLSQRRVYTFWFISSTAPSARIHPASRCCISSRVDSAHHSAIHDLPSATKRINHEWLERKQGNKSAVYNALYCQTRLNFIGNYVSHPTCNFNELSELFPLLMHACVTILI